MTVAFRVNEEDAKYIRHFMETDVRCERIGDSLRCMMEDTARRCKGDSSDETFWTEIKKYELPQIQQEIEDSDIGSKTFSLGNETFLKLKKSINESLGHTRPRLSFIVRLCMKSAYLERERQHTQGTDSAEGTNPAQIADRTAVELLRQVNERAAQLILNGSKADLEKIERFLE